MVILFAIFVKLFSCFKIFDYICNIKSIVYIMKTNYTSGQILWVKSSIDTWYYISVLRCATPVMHMNETYELHTCCDLYIDPYETDGLTFARGNGSLLDFDTCFESVREATDVEREYLYKALVRGFKKYDLGWANHFTDSTYDDIRDWLCWEFDVDINLLPNDSTLPATIYEITNYIWEALCKETGNYQENTTEPEMVNKAEFIAKVKRWLERETNWNMEYDEEGRNDNYGKIDELVKYLEE